MKIEKVIMDSEVYNYNPEISLDILDEVSNAFRKFPDLKGKQFNVRVIVSYEELVEEEISLPELDPDSNGHYIGLDR